MNLQLFLVRVIIFCVPVVVVLNFFIQDLQQCSSERGILDKLPFSGFIFLVPITSFLSSVKELDFASDSGTGALLPSQWGPLMLCALWVQGLLAPAE
jgi:hypothetical protein